MSVLRDLFVKNKIVFVLCALFLMSGCKKEDSDNIPEVPKGNPNQIILTVNGTEITEDMTDAKLGAYLIYNPFAGEDDIRGARKTVALSIAEALLLDQKAAENGTKTTAEEDAQTEILIEFVYKDKSRIEKAAAYKNIPTSEMLRDNLIEYMNTICENSSSKEETIQIVTEHLSDFEDIANDTIKDNGFSYQAKVELGTFEFPTKTYGDISFPSGYYDALKIELGNAQGQNWWCVLYPSLCFVDVTSGIVPDESKNELENNLNNEEYKLISDTDDLSIQFKFKLIEFFNQKGLVTAQTYE